MIWIYPGRGVYLGRATTKMAASRRILAVPDRPLHELVVGNIGVGAAKAVLTDPPCLLTLPAW